MPIPVKAIIYFRYKGQLNYFASCYPSLVACYYRDLEGKEEQLKSFLQGEKHILAATNAIGAGFDFHDVNLVIHYMAPWGLTDWVQQSGRLSRQPSQIGHSIIFMNSIQGPAQTKDHEEQLIYQYIGLDGCRQAFLNAQYNDEVKQFCQDSDLLCDCCYGRALALDQSQGLVQEHNQHLGSREEQLKAYIDYFQDHCIACKVLYYQLGRFGQGQWVQEGYDHQPGPNCPNGQQYKAQVDYWMQIFKDKQPPRDSCHYKCLLPSRFCHQWYQNREGCPEYNPILIWLGIMQASHLWIYIDSQYQPESLDRHSGGILAIQDIYQWFCKVDMDFFNTEALYGVLAFFNWAQKAEISIEE
jgi:hypothetical protein